MLRSSDKASSPQRTQITQTGNGYGTGERTLNGNDTRMGNHNGATFLALGDSYTIGEQVEASACWPVQLARALRGSGIAVEDPRIVATTGWTTDGLSAGMDAAALTGTWSLVSLLIGVNDQYRGRTVDEYRPRFRALLGRAIGLAGGTAARVIVLSIPDWGGMPFAEGRDRAAIGREIDRFNAAARAEVERAGARWVDVTPTSRAMRDGWAAPDGLHPSGTQYAAWAALALEPATAALATAPART